MMMISLIVMILALIPDVHTAAGSGYLMNVKRDLEVKAEASEDSKTVFTVKAGEAVFVTEDAKDGWSKILYQGKYYYVRTGGDISVTLDGENTDIEADQAEQTVEAFTFDEELQKQLESEFGEASEEADIQEQEVKREKQISVRSLIWKIVTGLIIAAMFAVGIWSVLRKKESEGKDTKEDTPSEEASSEEAIADAITDKTKDTEIEIVDIDADESLDISKEEAEEVIPEDTIEAETEADTEDEADNTDTMLQRSTDTSDNSERSPKEA